MDDEVEEEKCCKCNTIEKDDQISGPVCLDYKKTVIAQYANSTVLLSLLDYLDKEIKVCGFFDDFYSFIWNINTARGFGLDIWGRIVGVSRKVKTFMGVYWGFYEESLLIARPYFDADHYEKFNSDLASDQQSDKYYSERGMFRDLQGQYGNEYNGGDGLDLMEEYTFDDDDFRKLILAKAYANISDYSISSINFLLMALLSDQASDQACCKECCQKDDTDSDQSCCATSEQKLVDKREIYILDNLDMTLTIQLNWVPTKREISLIYNTGLLSRPAGVALYEINIEVK